jgi:hypothetical protein
MAAAQVQVHQLLKHQYGLRIAGEFMPHCTVKGFFKTDASEHEVRERAATIARDLHAFHVYNQGVVGSGAEAIVLSIKHMPGNSRNEPLQELHQRAIDALMPLVTSDCERTPNERVGEDYHRI